MPSPLKIPFALLIVLAFAPSLLADDSEEKILSVEGNREPRFWFLDASAGTLARFKSTAPENRFRIGELAEMGFGGQFDVAGTLNSGSLAFLTSGYNYTRRTVLKPYGESYTSSAVFQSHEIEFVRMNAFSFRTDSSALMFFFSPLVPSLRIFNLAIPAKYNETGVGLAWNAGASYFLILGKSIFFGLTAKVSWAYDPIDKARNLSGFGAQAQFSIGRGL